MCVTLRNLMCIISFERFESTDFWHHPSLTHERLKVKGR
jgi:hypothetical protein